MSKYIPDVVVAHHPCDDGWISAMVVASYYKHMLDKITFVAGNYANEDADYWREIVADKNVLVVDFSFKGAVKELIETAAASVVILDHHVTAKNNIDPDVIVEGLNVKTVTDMLADNKVLATFDMSRCGSMLAWNFFYPDSEPPTLVTYIDDQDRGVRKLPNAEEFTYWLRSQKVYKDYKNVGFLTSLSDSKKYKEAIDNGRAVKAYADIVVEDTIKGMSVGMLAIDGVEKEVRCGFTLAPYPIASTVASSALTQLPLDIAIVFYQVPELDQKRYGISVRSIKNSNYARLFAESVGGGGHDPAAGANFLDAQFLDLLSEMLFSSDSASTVIGEEA